MTFDDVQTIPFAVAHDGELLPPQAGVPVRVRDRIVLHEPAGRPNRLVSKWSGFPLFGTVTFLADAARN